MVIGLLVVFIAWALYRAFIKRDLMQHKPTLVVAGMFIGVWALLLGLFTN